MRWAMGDDLDDLLDEIEGEFREKSRKPATSSYKGTGHQSGSTAHCPKAPDELDLAIRDIFSSTDLEEDSTHKHEGRRRRSLQQTAAPPPREQLRRSVSIKCYQLLLGGSRVTMGQSTVTSQRVCDQLRCTSCDFRVIYFNDYVWHARCDYLFFRNNVPDFEALKKNLVRKKGYRAYACQCQWESVQEVQNVSTVAGKLKGHH